MIYAHVNTYGPSYMVVDSDDQPIENFDTDEEAHDFMLFCEAEYVVRVEDNGDIYPCSCPRCQP